MLMTTNYNGDFPSGYHFFFFQNTILLPDIVLRFDKSSDISFI